MSVRATPALDAAGGPSPHLRWLARGFVVVPIVVAVVRALATGWFPVGDAALLSIRAYDVGTAHHPLLGSWTSASLAIGRNVNNPGPLYLDLLAPFQWTIGRWVGIAAATAIGVGVLNVAAAIGTCVAAGRIGGWRMERWMLLLVAALTWAMGSELLFDIWQPHALLLPFCLLLVLTIGLIDGDRRMLVAWIAVLSVIVQTHVAFVYAGAVCVVAVAVTAVMRWRRGGRLPTMTWPAVVLALAWLQPVWEQLFGRGAGNLGRLAGAAGGGDLVVGPRTALKILAQVVALPPWWWRGGFAESVPSTPITQTREGPALMVAGLPAGWLAAIALLVVVAVLAAAALSLSGRDLLPARAAAVLSVALIAAAGIGLSGQAVTATGLGNHQVRWLFALAAFVHVVLAWLLVEGAERRLALRRSEGRSAVAAGVDIVLAVVIAGFVVANLGRFAQPLGPVADADAAATLERTFADLDRFDSRGPLVYATDQLRVFEPYSSAVLMRLRQNGVEFRVPDEISVRQFGGSRRVDGTEVAHVRQLERSDALRYDGEGCVLSLRSGVDQSAQGAADALIAAAAAELVAGPSVDLGGLPDDVSAVVSAAVSGDDDAAFRVVADALLPVLVDEGRIDPTPAIADAAKQTQAIVARVNSTLLLVVEPATACAAT